MSLLTSKLQLFTVTVFQERQVSFELVAFWQISFIMIDGLLIVSLIQQMDLKFNVQQQLHYIYKCKVKEVLICQKHNLSRTTYFDWLIWQNVVTF